MKDTVPASAVTARSEFQTAAALPAPEGFIFDPAHFPFTLLRKFSTIAKEIRDLGLEKTGGKVKDRDAKYSYFEEAEITAHLTALFNKHDIGYAFGAPRILGRFENGRTHSGGTMWAHHVKVVAIFSHKDSGEWIAIPGVGEAADAGDKGVTKAQTSGGKYIFMKTFMISDGNEIELNQSENGETIAEEKRAKSNPPARDTKKDTKSAEVIVNKCANCKGEIKPIQGARGKTLLAATVAAETKKKFGKFLCGDCAIKESKKSDADDSQDKPEGYIEGRLEKAVERAVTIKGKGKKYVVDLELHGGIRITDWHESHQPLYKQLGKTRGTPIELIITEKQNGKYTNRNVEALLSLDGEVIEDEEGNKVEPEERDMPPLAQRALDEETYITDDDIPF